MSKHKNVSAKKLEKNNNNNNNKIKIKKQFSKFSLSSTKFNLKEKKMRNFKQRYNFNKDFYIK